ncbi:hypothetical protein GL178_11605 [Vibrio toranzoniae]|uniref:Uncharacterized protein n=1 Tax=Vibrio toranzoniae TaxID=1194427 RepID=A0A109D575_9VIBR|nr:MULTISPECIES: hypothetical protein [Vibrio]KWT99113.1 hypothetical protein APQ14_17465 [Vibrio toranzoniae]MDA0146367.1 hypothetical protein [Vibrio sp. RW]NAZ46875.1 hypothetical protein [Vibrio toranzoniae]NAZ52054.1 hypothetical protein [Vibrio toranzoniae]NAZ93235.1 hypothetical protein [Vibrio toranzoniae]
MQFRVILMLCLAMMGCTSNQELALDPTSITLFYGDTSISAGVLEDKTFNSVLADRVESVTFSGSIRKQDSGYLVDMLVIRETKQPRSTRQLNTSLIMKPRELVDVGGVNNDVFRVILE